MGFKADDVRSSLSRINRKIRTSDFASDLISWKGAAIGFVIGAAALAVILCFHPLGPSRGDGMLLGIPFVTAVILPLLYSTTRGIITHLTSTTRRPRRPDSLPPDADPVDAGSQEVAGEWTDEDFIPSDEPDPVEKMRQEVRQRLADGATQREVEEELVARGLEPAYATAVVSSVRNSGRGTLPTEPFDEFRFDDPGSLKK
jgi:hypothetical protein